MARKKKQDDWSVMLCPPMFTKEDGSPDFEHKNLKWPQHASVKFDGLRVFCRAGELLTRNMLATPNRNLPGYLRNLCDYAKKYNLCFDMEVMDSAAEHHGDNTSVLNSHDAEIPSTMQALVFDCVSMSDWKSDEVEIGQPFCVRYADYKEHISQIRSKLHEMIASRYVAVEQPRVLIPKNVRTMYDQIVQEGGEGMILTAADGLYKRGRVTPGQATRTKWKHQETMDGQIIEVVQQRMMKTGLTRTRNAWGFLERPTVNANNFTVTDSVGALRIRTEDGIESEIAFGEGWNHDLRRLLWEKQKNLAKCKLPGGPVTGPLVGQWVEFIHVPCGAKDAIRHGRLLKFRPDKRKK